MKLFPMVCWFVCFLAGIAALGLSGIGIVSFFIRAAELQGDAAPLDIRLMFLYLITFCLGSICWGIAVLIELFARE